MLSLPLTNMASTESMPSGVVKFSCQYLETDPNSLKACLNHSINALSSANDHITDLTKQLQNATSDLKQCESDGQAITLFNDFLPLLILTCALLALVQIIRSWVADHRRLRNKQKVEL